MHTELKKHLDTLSEIMFEEVRGCWDNNVVYKFPLVKREENLYKLGITRRNHSMIIKKLQQNCQGINEYYHADPSEFSGIRALTVLNRSTNRFYLSHISVFDNEYEKKALETEYNHQQYLDLIDFVGEMQILPNSRKKLIDFELPDNIKIINSLDLMKITFDFIKHYISHGLISSKVLCKVKDYSVYKDLSTNEFIFYDPTRDEWFKVMGELLLLDPYCPE